MENETELKEKKNYKKSILLILLGVLIIILMFVGFNYITVLNNPRTLFKKTSDTIFNEAINMLNNASNELFDSFLYDGQIKFNTNIEDYSFLNSEVIDYKYGMDIKNNKAIANIKLTEDNKILMDIKGNVLNNNVYINASDYFDKTILIDSNSIQDNLNISISDIFDEINDIYSKENIEDTKYIINKLKVLTNEVIDNIKYSKDNEKIDINGKNVITRKITIDFTKENIDIIKNTYIDGILNDNDFINKLVEIIEIDKEDLIDGLEELKEYDDIDYDAKLVVYTKGIFNKVIKITLEENKEKIIEFINYNDHKLLTIDDIEIEIDDNKLKVKQDKEVILNGTINSLKKDYIDIDFESVESDVLGNITYQNTLNNIKLKVDIEDTNDTKVNLDLNYKKNNAKEKEIYIIILLQDKNGSLKIINGNKMTIDSEIQEYSISNYINYKDITEEDLLNITKKIEDKFSETKIADIINSYNEDMNYDLTI